MSDELNRLVDKAFEAIRREINNLTQKSAQGKLDAASARDLIAYYKLLKDMQRQQDDDDEALKKLTDEQLEEIVKSELARRGQGAATPQDG